MKSIYDKKIESKTKDLLDYYQKYSQKNMQVTYDFYDAIRNMISLCGGNINHNESQETPIRVFKKLLEYTSGYSENPEKHLEKQFKVKHNEQILVKDIDFNSICEHHLSPIFGQVHVSYLPYKKITGLSKIARMVDGYTKRFQVQERFTHQIRSEERRVGKECGDRCTRYN